MEVWDERMANSPLEGFTVKQGHIFQNWIYSFSAYDMCLQRHIVPNLEISYLLPSPEIFKSVKPLTCF